MTAADIVIVTAADDAFTPFAAGLIQSICDAATFMGVNAPPVHIIDLGLSLQNRTEFQKHATVGKPVDIARLPPVAHFSATHILSCWVKPRLPDLVAGFRRYIWIDADAWVQDWSAIDLLQRGCDMAGFAAVPELDRGYLALYDRASRHLRINHDWYADAYGEDIAKDLIFRPVINAGVWAANAASAVWPAWRRRLDEALARGRRYANDQAALNRAIYHDHVGFHPLPCECNWICCHALPRWDSMTATLTEPTLPHRKLGIIHMTRACRDVAVPVPTDGGRVMNLKLDYPSIRPLR